MSRSTKHLTWRAASSRTLRASNAASSRPTRCRRTARSPRSPPVEGHGFIQAGERQVYFTRASVLDDAFDELEVGTPVAFVEEKGEKGPQASTVRVLGKHHYVTH